MPAKVLIPLILIVTGITWLAFTNLSKANYFFVVNEVPELGDRIYQDDIKVKGRIVAASIKAGQNPVAFTIAEHEKSLVVHYVGEAPLPDMFKDHAETVVEGSMRADGVFEAEHLQAKCASKYEAMAPDASEGQQAQPAAPTAQPTI